MFLQFIPVITVGETYQVKRITHSDQTNVLNLPVCFGEEQVGELHEKIYVFDFNIKARLCVRLPTNKEFANSQ